MIKVNLQTNAAERASLPRSLKGLKPESLKDLSWTDPSLGLHGYGWWPESDDSPQLGEYQRYGDETLTVDAVNQRVIVVREVLDWSEEEIEDALQAAKKSKTAELHASCDEDLKQLAKGYPERETQTWVVQLEEAKAYLADNTSPTPFISAALKDGETVEQYANLIVANNAAWSDYAGKVVLKRRTYEAAINAATTIDEVRSISWRL